MPFSLTSNSVTCATCGEINTISQNNEEKHARDAVNNNPKATKKSTVRKLFDGLVTFIAVIILIFFISEKLGYDLKKYFYFSVTVPQKVELSKADIHNFSHDGIMILLQRFQAQLISSRWFESASSRSSLNAQQIRACLGINVVSGENEDVWIVEFNCQTDFKYSSDGIAVAKEVKNRFEVFLRANKTK